MVDQIEIEFASLRDWRAPSGSSSRKDIGTLVLFVSKDLRFAPPVAERLGDFIDGFGRAAATARFQGRNGSALDLLAPAGPAVERLLIIGTGPRQDKAEAAPPDYVALGGMVAGKLAGTRRASVIFALPEPPTNPADAAADFSLGVRLRKYKFDLYKTQRKDEDEKETPLHLTVLIDGASEARRQAKSRAALAEGVGIARTLVNEPPNVLFPATFAERTRELEQLGVEVEIVDERAMQKLGMNALLGVSQGSQHKGCMALMRWNGGKEKVRPVAFIGKGVCFDTGGISIKPGGGMEDMKGDMAGAACVVGLMHSLAARKAKVNAIGAIGLVENTPSGTAQRPGDIVKSMSGQTIEIINTDAEGRLVLADVLWYVQDRYKPLFMIDLATLTGAILVALGQEHAGLFSNDDELATRLAEAGRATGEKVWRMPLGPAYDKMIDSKFADMKNVGGRQAGSITAAQFLRRFVNDVPWAHLDIAGTGLASPQTDINQSWGSGWGVRLLDRLVADHYET